MRKCFILDKIIKEQENRLNEEVSVVNHSPIIKSQGIGMHKMLSISFNLSMTDDDRRIGCPINILYKFEVPAGVYFDYYELQVIHTLRFPTIASIYLLFNLLYTVSNKLWKC